MEEKNYNLIKNEDGTLTMNVFEGVQSTGELGYDKLYSEVSVINFPSSLKEFCDAWRWKFNNLKEFYVHADSPYFTFEDGVIFSKDKKKIVVYQDCEGRNSYKIPDTVVEIKNGCFAEARDLARIDIGKNVRKIENRGLHGDGYFLMEKIYIPATVVELEGEIFDAGADDGGIYYPISIVGGERGSVIEEYCNNRGITFVEVRENEIEEFYATSVGELRKKAKAQIESEKEFFVDGLDKGYQMRYADGTLEIFVPDDVTMTEICIRDTRVKLNEPRRDKVKKIVIGERITRLYALAFDDYENLETVYIGKDVESIDPWTFSGKDASGSYGCAKLISIELDENNKWYKVVDGALYTYDMETLVKYCPSSPAPYYEIAPQVRHIGEGAFHYAKNLRCLKIGNGVISIGNGAFCNVASLRHVYIAESVTEWPEFFPFVEQYGYDRPYHIDGLVIGGPGDSFIQKYCADNGVRFLVIGEERIGDFLATPLPVIKHNKEDSDPYIAECNKQMLIGKDGALIQAGKFDEELVLPEGVVYIRCSIDLSKCKRVFIPSTYTHPWGIGVSCDGFAPELEEFIVAEDNPQYVAIDGHLYGRDGTLMTYAPATHNQGVLPDGTTGVAGGAFSLLPKPLERLYIPATLKSLTFQLERSGVFYGAEISSDNTSFKAIDGSIFTADEKTLVYAKVYGDGYKVPDGTEIISKGALAAVRGTVYIPESVTKIEYEYGIPSIDAIRTAKGSYAEQYAKEHKIRAELIMGNEIVEVWEPQKPQYLFAGDDDLPF